MKLRLFLKWSIFWTCYFPDNIFCKKCNKNLDTLLTITCPECNTKNKISSIIPKPRPVILWIEEYKWCENVTFGIPLSGNIESYNFDDKFNQLIQINTYEVADEFKDKKAVFRAVINQSTRIDGNCIKKCNFFGLIKDEIMKEKIENKLRNWLNL